MASLAITELTWGGLVPASGGVATPTLKYEYVDDNGNLFTTGATVTWERVKIARNSRDMLLDDPWFVRDEALNIRPYDFSSSPYRTIARVPIDECPTGIPCDFTKAVRVRNTGTGTSFAGGFYVPYMGDNDDIFAGNTYVCSFMAWVQGDRLIYPTNNSMGTGGYNKGIRGQSGWGRWRMYGSEMYFGPGASTAGYYGLRPEGDGTEEKPLDWWFTGLLFCQVSNLSAPSDAPALDTATGALTIPPTTSTVAQALEWGAVKVSVTMNGQTTYAVSAPEQAPALDWVSVDPMSGGDQSSVSIKAVKVSATENRSLTAARSGLVTFKTSGNKFATLNLSQPAASVSFGTLTASLSYPTAAAKGGSVSPSLTWSLPFGFNGSTSNGGTISRAADGTVSVTTTDSHAPTTITGVSTTITYSMSSANGATLSSTSTGAVSVPSLGTSVTSGSTTRGSVTAAVSVTIAAGTEWGGATASKSATATTSVLQERNVKSSSTYGAVSLSVSPTSVSVVATGGTFTLSASASQTRTDNYTSGSYDVAVTPSISFGNGSASWLTKGTTGSSSASYTAAVNGSTSSRSGSVTVTASGEGSKSASKTIAITQAAAAVSFGALSASLSYNDNAAAGGDAVLPTLTWSVTYGLNGATSGAGTITSANYINYSGVSLAVSYAWGNTAITGGSIDSSSGKVTTPSAGNTISTSSVTLGNVTATVTVTIAANSSIGNSSAATISGNATGRVYRDPNTATATRSISLSLDKTSFTAAGGTTVIRAAGAIAYKYTSGSTTAGSGLPTTFDPSVSLSSTDGFSMNGTSFYCTSHGTTVYPSTRSTTVQATYPSKPSYTGVTFTDGSTKSVSVTQSGNYCTGTIEVSVDKSSLSAAGETTKVYGQVVYSFSSGSKKYNPATLSGSATGFTFAGRTGDTSVSSGSTASITSYVYLTAASRGTTTGAARSITITASDNTSSPSVGYTKATSKTITVTQVANAVTGTTYGAITISLPYTTMSVAAGGGDSYVDRITASQAVTTTYTSGSTSSSTVSVSSSLTYSSSVTWMTLSVDEDDGSLLVRVSANTATSSRSGTITVAASANGKTASKTITVTQAAAEAWGLYASSSSVSLSSSASTGSFYVTKKTTSGTAIAFTSASQVNVTPSVTWLTVSSTTLTSSGQILVSFSATANTTTTGRTGAIGVQSTEDTSKAVGVTIGQAAKSTVGLTISSSTISVGASSGQTASVTIRKTLNGSSTSFTSASQVSVSSKPSWATVSLSLSSGAIIATITTSSANTSSSSRSGAVTFTSTEDSTKSVSATITQAAQATSRTSTITLQVAASNPASQLNAYFSGMSAGDSIYASIWETADENADEPFYVTVGTFVSASVSGTNINVVVSVGSNVSYEVDQLRSGDMMECDPLYIGNSNDEDPEVSWSPQIRLSGDEGDATGEYAATMLADAMESASGGDDVTLACVLNI